MSFWIEHERAEAALAESERAKLPPSLQNAPDTCLGCGHLGTDVLFGGCLTCFEAWEATRV